MPTWVDNAKQALDLLSSTTRGLELLGKIARAKLETNKGGDAMAVLRIVADLADIIQKGLEGKVDSEAVEKHIEASIASIPISIEDIDKATRDAIDKKFPTG